MSRVIDERVVSMQFDNRQFEANVHTSMSTLDKLKASLNLSGAAKGLDNISAAARNFTVSGITNGVTKVQAEFSALEVMAVTTIANITNSMVNAGKRIASEFTIEPIYTGFQEYELKMSSVQTIMASTGESIDKVNQYLAELNEYSDKTIYSFSDMTQNIGKFTNAGVDLDKAVLAIKGISNEAAVSGANANEASRAMYNFAQALSAGYVKLIDWKSIENANMATVEFKQALIDTAVELGAVVKVGDEYKTLTTNAKGKVSDLFTATKGFNEALENQWMTTDVLVATLSKYSDETTELGKKAYASAQDIKTFSMMMETLKEAAQSGWSETWELILGDFEEAKYLWTKVGTKLGDMIADSAKERNELIGGALSSKWSLFTKELDKAGISVDAFEDKLKEVAKTHDVSIDSIIEKEGSLFNAIRNGSLSKDLIVETLKSFTSAASGASDATGEVTESLEKFEEVVDKVINGAFGNGEARINALTEAGYDYATVQGLVNKVIKGETVNWKKLTKAEAENLGLTEDQIAALKELQDQSEATGTPINELIDSLDKPSGRDLLIDSIKNAAVALQDIMWSVKKAWSETFSPVTSDQIYGFLEVIHALSTNLSLTPAQLDKLTKSFKGLFAIVKIVTTIFGGGLHAAVVLVVKALGAVDISILDITAKIGDAIVAFQQWLYQHSIISKAFNLLGNILVTVASLVAKFAKEIYKLPKVQSVISKIGDSFSKMYDKINDGLNKIKDPKQLEEYVSKVFKIAEKLKNLSFTDIIEGIANNLTKANLTSAFTSLKENLIGWMMKSPLKSVKLRNDITTFAKVASSNLEGLGETASAAGKDILDLFKTIFDKISDNVGFAEILTLGMGGSLILFIKDLQTTIKTAKQAFDIVGSVGKSFTDMMNGVTGVLGGVKGVLGAYQKQIETSYILKIAAAIAIMAGSLWVLSQIPTDKLLISAGVMISLAGALLGFAAAANAIDKIALAGGSNNSFTIVALAGSLLIMVAALKVMDTLNPDTFWRNIWALAGMLVALAVVSSLMGKYAPDMSKGAFTLIAIGIALKIMVSALKDLDGINFEHFWKDMGALVGIMLAAIALGDIACTQDPKGFYAVLAVAISLKLFISALNDITKLDVDAIVSKLPLIVGILLGFSFLMKASSKAGKHSAQAGLGILAMSASLILIALAIKLIGTISNAEIDKSIGIIAGMFVLFGAIVAVSKFAGEHAAKAGVMLLAMSASMLILAFVITIMSHISPAGLERAVTAVVILGVLYGALIAVTKLAGDSNKVKTTILMISISIAILAAAIAALAFVPADGLTRATNCLAEIMVMLGVVIASTYLAKNAMSTILAITAAIAVIALMFIALDKLEVNSALTNAAAIGIVLVTMAGVLLATSKINAKDALKTVGVLALMGLVVGEIALIFGLMSKFGVDSGIEKAASLSLVLLAMSAACYVMKAIPVTSAVTGALSLITFVGIIGTAIAMIGSIFQDDTAVKAIQNGGKILYNIGNAIGSFFGGLSAGVTAGLPAMGQNLNDFMTNAKPFFDAVKEMGPETTTSVKTLIESLSILGGATLKSAISSMFGDDTMKKFAKDISKFSEAIVSYSENVSGGKIDVAAIEASARGARAIAEVAQNIPRTGKSLGSLLIGTKDLGTFGVQLGQFGFYLKTYSEKVTGIDTTAIEKSATAAEALTKVVNNIPREGGAIEWLIGSRNLESLTSGLFKFGVHMRIYAEKVSGIDTTAIENSATAAEALTKVVNNIPRAGGAIQWLAGSKDIGSFGSKLALFGLHLVSYAESVKGLGDEGTTAITNSSTATEKMIEVANKIPKSGGILSKIAGSKDIASFGEKLEAFAEKLHSYALSTTGLNLQAIENSKKATDTIISLAKSAQGVNFSGLTYLTKSLEKMGSSSVDNFLKSFNSSGDKLNTAGKTMMTQLSNGMKSGTSSVAPILSSIFTTISNMIASRQTIFLTYGKILMNAMSLGMASTARGVSTSASTAVSSAVSSIRTKRSDFKDAGEYLGGGLVKGINSKQKDVYDAGYALGQKAVQGEKDGQKSNSPSKLTIQAGKWFGEGLVIGIDRMGNKVYDSAYGLGSTAVKSMSSSIARISELVNTDIDTQPTISPVLDLSSVETGVTAIGGLFSGTNYGINANLSSISSAMNARNQNGTTDDVIMAIGELSRKISRMPVNTYNVNGITYDDGSNISEAVSALIRAARVERRV